MVFKYLIIFLVIILFFCFKTKEMFNNLNPKIAIVIPCVPKHIKYLKDLFQNINQQTRKPYKVIVTLSSSDTNSCNLVKNLKPYLDKNIKLIVDCCSQKKNAASNRNRSLKHCLDVQYISFMDADDEMSNNKLKIITDLMIKYNADMGLHSLSNGDSKNKFSIGNKVYSPEQMKKIEKNDRKNLHISNIIVCHGHSTITINLFKNHKQNENIKFGEDSHYVRDTFKKNYRVAYTNAMLSSYYYKRSTHSYGINKN